VPPEAPQYMCFETPIAFWFASLIDNYKAKPIEGKELRHFAKDYKKIKQD
jgi:hypothetical protein